MNRSYIWEKIQEALRILCDFLLLNDGVLYFPRKVVLVWILDR